MRILPQTERPAGLPIGGAKRQGSWGTQGAEAQARWLPTRADATSRFGRVRRISLGRHDFSPLSATGRMSDASGVPLVPLPVEDEKPTGVASHMNCSDVPLFEA